MRIGMISALCILLPFIFSPRPAAAQLNPASSQLSQDFLRRLPSLANKVSELPRVAESGGVGLHADLANEPTNVLQTLRNGAAQLNNEPEETGATGIQPSVGANRCAHIVIYQAPIIDSKMIIHVPREFASNMPTWQGLQACCRDFRSVIAIPQFTPFMGPGRIGPLAPNPPMRLYGKPPF